MTALQSIFQKLPFIGLPEPEDTSPFYAELAAYSEGLQMLYDYIDEVYREMFLSTASEDRLAAFQQLFAICSADPSVDAIRSSLILAASITDQNAPSILCDRLCDLYHINGQLTANGNHLIFTCSTPLSPSKQAAIQSHMQRLMPLYTTFEFICTT